MMCCDDYLPFIHLYLDDEITKADRDALLAHLETCPRCRALLDDYSRLAGELRALPQHTPPTLHRDIMRHIDRKTTGFWRRRTGKRLAGLAACAALLVLVFAGGDHILRLPARQSAFSLQGGGVSESLPEIAAADSGANTGGEIAGSGIGSGIGGGPPTDGPDLPMTFNAQAARLEMEDQLGNADVIDYETVYTVGVRVPESPAYAGYLAAAGPGALPSALREHASLRLLEGAGFDGIVVSDTTLIPWVAQCLTEAGFALYGNLAGSPFDRPDTALFDWLIVLDRPA